MYYQFTNLPAFVLDQLLLASAVNLLYGNADHNNEILGKRHQADPSGEHDDEQVARVRGTVKYLGTFGSGGIWVLSEGTNLAVSEIGAAPGTVGRSRINFVGTWAAGMLDSSYAVIVAPYMPADVSSETTPKHVRWFNRTPTSFDVSAMRDTSGAGSWVEESSAAFSAYSVLVYGIRA